MAELEVQAEGEHGFGGRTAYALERIATVARYHFGQTIYFQDAYGDCWYRIVGGAVRECVLTPDGRRQVVDFLFRGIYLGFPTATCAGYPERSSWNRRSSPATRAAIGLLGARCVQIKDHGLLFKLGAAVLPATREYRSRTHFRHVFFHAVKDCAIDSRQRAATHLRHDAVSGERPNWRSES